MSAHQRNRKRRVVAFEGLESRQLFNAIAWTGAGDGVTWHNPANWAGGVVPGFADDVTINVAASPNIQIFGSRTVKSLNCAESITITNGASLSCNSTVSSSGVITMNGALIAGGSWNFAGAGHIEIAANSQNQIGLGAMINGDINLAAANGRVSIVSNSTFYNVHLAADQTSVAFPANSTINGNIVFEGIGTGGRYVEGFNQAGSLLISSSASIRTVAGFAGTAYIGTAQWFGNSIGALNNGGVIASDVNGRAINIATTQFHNTVGSVNANNGGVVNIISPNWTNDDLATFNVNAGSTLTTSGAWSDAGNINLTNGTINFGGTFSASTFDFASFHRAGGTVNITGALNNNIPSLTLNTQTGSWNLRNGTINGGVLNFAGGSIAPTDQGGTFQDVTINGDLNFSATSAHAKILGTTTFDSIHLTGESAGVGFAPGFTLDRPIVLDGSATSLRYVETVGTGAFTIGSGGSIEAGAGFGGAAQIGSGNWYGGSMTLTNNGMIRNAIAGRTITLIPTAMFNNGTIVATNNSTIAIGNAGSEWHNTAAGAISSTDSTLTLGGVWGTLGSLNIANSTLNLGGLFATSELNIDPGVFWRTGGTVNITGTLNNSSLVFWQNANTGSWNLKGGTISGGHMSYANGQMLDYTSTGGTLKDLSVHGDVTVDTNNARVTISGTTTFDNLRLSGDNTAAAFSGGYTLNVPIYFEGIGPGGRSVESTGGALTISPTGSIRTLSNFGGIAYIGQNGQPMTLVNNGLIRSDVLGRALYMGGASFTNNGQVQLAGATVTMQPFNWTNALGATFSADASTVSFLHNWANRGALAALSGSTLNLGGNWRTSEFNFGSFTNSASTVNITGNLDNGDSVLHFNANTGDWHLKGGTITGGQMDFTDGYRFKLTSSAGNLNSLLVHGDIWASDSFARALMNVETKFDTLHLVGDGSSAQLQAGYILDGKIEFGGSGNSSRNIQLYTPGTLTVTPTGSIKTVPGFAGVAYIGQDLQPMKLINNGVIESNVSGMQMSVVPQTGLDVNGTMRSIDGGVLRVFNTNAMNVAPPSNVVANSIRAGALWIDGSVTIAPGGTNSDLSIVNALTMQPGSTLDLNNNDLLINYTGNTPCAAVQALLNSGRAGGTWSGVGIRSTSAKNNALHNTALAMLEASEFIPINGGAFDGQFIDNTALLLKYTYYGDTDLNGIVNFDDYSRIDNGFSTNKTGWVNGDFDSNGVINFDDYSLIDLAFNTQGAAQIGDRGPRNAPRISQL